MTNLKEFIVKSFILIIAVAALLGGKEAYKKFVYLNNSRFKAGTIEYIVVDPPALLKRMAKLAPKEQVEFFVYHEAPYAEGFSVKCLGSDEKKNLLNTYQTILKKHFKKNFSFDFADAKKSDGFYGRVNGYFLRETSDSVVVYRDRNVEKW